MAPRKSAAKVEEPEVHPEGFATDDEFTDEPEVRIISDGEAAGTLAYEVNEGLKDLEARVLRLEKYARLV